jgi:uncharacterized membrane protein YcfT
MGRQVEASVMQLHQERVAWVDYAKGFCIVMVVMMHSTLGVEQAAGAPSWMGATLDRKVLHFAYFYMLWVTIQFAFKAPDFAAEAGCGGVAVQYALTFIDPFGTLWFIYLLPVFFVVTKATRDVPPVIVWVVAALLQIAQVHTGATVIDEFCARFVYFYSGYVLAPYVFRFAATVARNKRDAIRFLVAWTLLEALMVFGGYSALPVIGLGLGFLGALAVIALSSLLSTRDWARPLRYAGQNSIVIYLAFFLPMAATRASLLKLAPGLDLGLVALTVTAVAAITPLLFYAAVKRHLLALPVQAARLGTARASASPYTGGVNPNSARFACRAPALQKRTN